MGWRLRGGCGAALLLLLALQLELAAASAKQRQQGSPLPPNVYVAAFNDVSCKSDVVVQPTSTNEVAAHILTQAQAAAAAGLALKVRASHRGFHSTAAFPCPGKSVNAFPAAEGAAAAAAPGSAGGAAAEAQGTTTLTLLTDSMRRVLAVDKDKGQMRVQSGIMVTQLLEEAAAANLTVPLGSVTTFGDLTLGGVLVTGGHGTGHLDTSSLGDIVREITWVDGLGNVHVSDRNSTAGRALVGGLGISGVVTELLIQLNPPSHTRVSTRYKKSDANLLQDVQEMLKETPHVLVVWRPDLKQYTAFLTTEVPTSVPSTGGIMALDLPKLAAQALGLSLAAWQADLKDNNRVAALPVMAAIQETSVGHSLANRADGGRMLEGVGDTNRMQAASCGDRCLWHLGSKIAMDDVHMSIEMDHLGEWIDDVKRLLEYDLWELGERPRRTLSPGYFWLRFGRGSEDFLAHTSGMVAPVHVQMSFMKAMHNPQVPNKHTWVLETIEQFTLCKYLGKPHWGKNHERTFLHPLCKIKDHLPRWQEAMDFREKSDPGHVFEPALFADMAAGRARGYSPGCSLRGECYCQEDAHCAAGHRCLPSYAFPQYKACRAVL